MEVLSRGSSFHGMPTGQTGPHGQSVSNTGTARRQSSNTKPSNANGGNNVGFTFVDQSDDWKSLENKRIVSSQQRHAIRSHVMRSVRHNETVAGKKRPTGRESSRKTSDSHANGHVSLSQAPSVSPTLSAHSNSPRQLNGRTARANQQLIKLPPSPSDRIDPFFTLPGHEAHANIIDGLTKYCFKTFIPMTFPRDRVNNQEAVARKENVLQNRFQNPATFFGMMATVAVHRALISGRHYDLEPSDHNHDDLLFDNDFKVMKAIAMAATRNKIIADGAMDEATVEAVFSLIAAASILGNFEEARLHLKHMRQVLQDDSQLVDLASPATHWICITDVKAAMAMMRRPYYRIPWEPQPFSDMLIRKITPRMDTEIRNLGSAFQDLGGLSERIRELLQISVQLCWFYHFNNHNSGMSLHPADHEAFRRKTLELEYDLLSYIYVGSPSATDQVENDLIQTPIEQMIRMAVLGMLSSTFTHVLPSAGVGRALTRHQMNATQQSVISADYHTSSARCCLVWIMLQYAHNALGQKEEQLFINCLASMCKSLDLNDWQSVENLCCKYLYVPAAQASSWRLIWKRSAIVNGIITSPL